MPFKTSNQSFLQKEQKYQYEDILITNGSKLPHKNYNFSNTSIFDSFVELLVYTANNFITFKEELFNLQKRDSADLFKETVCSYIQKRNLTSFYQSRLTILLKYRNLQGSTIYCNGNLKEFIEIFMDGYHSFTQIIKCDTCNLNIFNNFMCCSGLECVSQISEFLETNFNSLTKTCEQCLNNAFIQWDFKQHFIICTENNKNSIKLNEIKEQICIKEKFFYLSGIISYTPIKSIYSEEHYIAYCRSLAGHWKKFDSLEKNVTNASKNTQVLIAALIYVHNN